MLSLWSRYSLLLSTAIIASCGGGASNDSGSKKPENEIPFIISFAEQSIDLESNEYQKTVLINASISGNPGAENFFVITENTGEAIESVNAIFSETTGTLSVTTKDELWSGEYQGNVIINVCADELCGDHIAGSPYTIPYSISIETSRLRLRPEFHPAIRKTTQGEANHSLTLYTEQDTELVPLKVNIDLPSSIVDLYFPPKMVRELSITDLDENSFYFTPSNNKSGEFFDNYEIDVESVNGSESKFELQLANFVSQAGIHPDDFHVFEKTLRFRVPQNRFEYEDVSRSYFVPVYIPYNPSNSEQVFEFSTSYQSGDAWLRPSSEQDSTDANTFKLELSAKDMEEGLYKAETIVTNFDGQSQSINIEMLVYTGIIDIHEDFEFSAELADVGFRTISFETTLLNDDVELNWSVESLDDWLVVAPEDKGNNTHDRNFKIAIDADYIAALANDTVTTGYLRINHHVAEEETQLRPGIVTVNLKKALPQVNSLSTYLIPAGQAFELSITGLNLSESSEFAFKPIGGDANIANLVHIPYTVTVLEGGVLVVKFEAFDGAGEYELMALSNLDYEHDLQKQFVSHPVVTFVD